MPQWAPQGNLFTLRHTSPSQFRFDWQLSGDRAVAPLQVFDDGRRTWLQFAPSQPVPAIFEVTPAGDRPLAYRVEGPYVVLQGVWPQLALRGGHQQSWVQRTHPNNTQPIQRVPAVVPSSSSDSVGSRSLSAAGQKQGLARQASAGQDPAKQGSVLAASDGLSPSPSGTTVSATTVVPGSAQLATSATPQVADVSAIRPTAPPSSTQPVAKEAGHALATTLTASSFAVSSSSVNAYSVSPQDATIRQALVRWARESNWTFEPEHWAVDVDIPLSGSAVFETDFKQAVRQLVAATELADRPLQPCFYSNRVLRIVPFAQACDRGLGNGRTS